jgi:rubrerythrin
MMLKRLLPILVLTLIAAPLFATPGGKTLANLQAAYNGESNANARYLAFADKAKEEGYLGIATLFRAAATAEGIHAKTHGEVITKLGGTPEAKIEKPEVKATRDNLLTAEKGEIYERDVMYPEFIKTARDEKELGALQAFNFAKNAEAEHAKLYGAAAKNPDAMKANTTFYVCSVCGKTVTDMKFKNCPVCANPKEKFLVIS